MSNKMTMKRLGKLAANATVAAPCGCLIDVHNVFVTSFCDDYMACSCDSVLLPINEAGDSLRQQMLSALSVGYMIAARDLKEQQRAERNRKAKRRPSVRAR